MVLKRVENFKKLESWSFKFIDLVIIFWINNKIKPIPSSIAEKTKEKKVKDNMFKLLYTNPINNIKVYKVIHKSSAVRRRCKDVLVFINILKIIKKKNKNNIFKLSTIIIEVHHIWCKIPINYTLTNNLYLLKF